MRGDPAVLRVVECPLEVVEARSDDDSPPQALVVDADERRQGVQNERHLRDHAGHADVLGTPTQGRTDLGRVEKTQEGVLGVGARSHDARIDLLAVRQGDAFHGASPGADGRDVDTASHRRAVASCRSEERLGQPVRPAPGEDGTPRRSSTRGRVPQEVERSPRGSWAHGGVANAPRPEHATQRFVVDCLAHEIRDGHGQDSQRLVDLPLAKMPQGVREREALEAVRGRRSREIRRLGRLDAAQEPDERADLAVEGEERLGVTAAAASAAPSRCEPGRATT